MTDKKKFKARVRERMARTGESYTTAQRNLESGSGTPSMPRTSSANWQEEYKKNRRRFREQSLGDWRNVTEELAGMRTMVSWTDITDITKVLSQVAQRAPLNHTFYPDGGGLDLTRGASASHESGCIELNFENQTTIVRPISLQLVMPERDPLREWAYFLLDTGVLAPSGIYEGLGGWQFEEVLELGPGQYADRSGWDEGFHGYDEEDEPLPLPKGARVVTRYFQGSFLIMAKASTYMSIDSYSGYHATRSAAQFQSEIESLIDHLHRKGTYGKDPRTGD